MAKKSSKQKRDRKRKQEIKQKKARARAVPKLLRNEVLADALSTRYPLVECLINEDWQEEAMAHILVIRDAPGSLVFGLFVVDLQERGLQDAWGSLGVPQSEIETLKAEASRGGLPLVPCEQGLAEKIVHGGIAWAKKWAYKLPREYRVWTRLLEASPSSGSDLSLFGMGGEPFSSLEDMDKDGSYEEILSKEIEVTEEGFSRETLIRIGDIKRALISFANSPAFAREMSVAFKQGFDERKPPDLEEERINLMDWFLLEYELKKGGTLADLFVEHYEEMMSEDVQELILGWQEVLVGLFEVKRVFGDALDLKNLINERDYRVFPTALFDEHGFRPGDFLFARIVPAKHVHLFSGAVKTFPNDGIGNENYRAMVYRKAIEMQAQYPLLAFKDNPEKLEKSRDLVRSYYDAFLRCFGAEELLAPGKRILEQYREFLDTSVHEMPRLKGGDAPGPWPAKVQLPEEVLKSDDVGMLCDPVEGIFFLTGYGRFVDVFRSPDAHLGKKETEDRVMGYLGSDSVSDVPFRRMAERFPDNFKRVIEYYRDQEGFYSTDIEDLMMEFKPWTFEKWPGMVAVLDAEMARVAGKSAQEPSSVFGWIKRWFRK